MRATTSCPARRVSNRSSFASVAAATGLAALSGSLGPGAREARAGAAPRGEVTPLVLALGSETAVMFAEAPTRFDFYGTGEAVGLTWPAAGFAFLALDVNGNGRIDDGRELFGDGTALLADAEHTAENGFVALAQHDDNGDGVIDHRDAVWPKLVLWIDAGGDGLSSPAELTRVADHGVTALPLAFVVAKPESARAGSQLLVGNYKAGDGSSRLLADVWLRIHGE
jgi:hypothetical protein